MKIISLSDLHGFLPSITEQFDLLLICGDICPRGTRKDQYNFLVTKFTDWANYLPFKDIFSEIILIAGNHDSVFEGIRSHQLNTFLHGIPKLVYLDNQSYEYIHSEGVITIFGTPYCKKFGSWSFMRDDLTKYYNKIPDRVDILISHDAADICNLGLIQNGYYTGENAGNKVLADFILQRDIKYYFCGHIHSGNHRLSTIQSERGFITCANVSILNEHYELAYPPLILDI